MCLLIRQRRRSRRLRSYQRRLTHHSRQPRSSATRSVAALEVQRLDLLTAADEYLAHELGREEAVLDDAGRGGEERREVARIANRPAVVGDQPAVGAVRHVADLHVAQLAQRGRQSELRQLEGYRWRQLF